MLHDQLGLFDTPPDRRQARFSLALAAVPIFAFFAIFPVRNVRLPQFDVFIPMIDSVMLVGDLLVAALLCAQAAVFRSRALTVLAAGYLFTALIVIPHALTFPGAFAPNGLLGADVGTAAWLATLRRAALPVAIILYVLLKRSDAAVPLEAERPAPRTAIALSASIFLAGAVTVLATLGHDLLPVYFLDPANPVIANAHAIEFVILALLAVATVLLFRNRSSVLDMWLLVAFAGWLIQSLLIVALDARFTVGWYGLYLLMLFSHLVVLLALVAESNRLYARLALSTAARRRERDARLMSMDAVAGAISHEIGQPLTAVLLNANAAHAWLDRERPDLEMAARALRSTIEAGHRATDIVKSIRAIFAKGRGKSTLFSLNDLVRDTAILLGRELDGENAELQLALDDALPPIHADRLQLQLVLVNLFANAIESLGATQGRPRRIDIRSTLLDGEDVLLEVSDTGVGLDPDRIAQIFDAFYTTKPTGTGLGLSLSRTIVEGHGGRLWASPGADHGATFHLQLPHDRRKAA